MKRLFLMLVLAAFAFPVFAAPSPDGLPKPRKGTFALTNATLVTVSGDVIENGTLVIRDGKIEALGADVTPPDDAEVIDCEGMSVYPGFIDSGTGLGLVEISSVAETRDNNELGEITPHMKALTAINPNSVLIATARVSGVTTVISNPSGGLLPGTAALVNLVGYTPEQMHTGFEGIVVNFPVTGRRGPFDRRSEEDIKKAADKALKQLNEAWDQAKMFTRIDSAYTAQPEENRMPDYNPAMQAMTRAVRDEVPLLIEVNSAKDIQSAIEWVQERDLSPVFTGCSEGWRVADEIAEAGIPCIVGPVLSMPTRESDQYDRAYANAGLLHKAGVKVAIRTNETSNVRNLPYHAGFAATYGLGKDAALKAVTLVPAEIFGVDDQLGSLETGKSATLFVAGGDPFETRTQIEHVFIDGYLVPMVDRQIRLYEEFLEREPGLEKD